MIFALNDNRFFLYNPMSFNRFILMNTLESTIQSISFHIGSHSHTFGTIWQHRQVPPLITDELSLLINYRVKLTGTSREEHTGSTIPTLKLCGSTAPSSRPFRLAVCVFGMGRKFYVDTRFQHAQWDPTIVMAVHNNDDILMLYFEDLPDGDKGIISKATEEFQNKCLLSYTKTRDNTIVQKFHYQEFYYTGRRIRLKMKIGVSLRKLQTNLFVMPYQAITKLSQTHFTTP